MNSLIYIYTIDGCPYSRKALELLKEHEIIYKHIIVSKNNKDKIKKMNKMDTFPQIFIIKSGDSKKKSRRVKIGGSDILLFLIQISHIMKYNNISINKVREFLEIY